MEKKEKDQSSCECENSESVCECKHNDEQYLSQIEDLNNKISELELHIKEINVEYVEKLKLKMEQANQLLQEKTDAIYDSTKKEIQNTKKYAFEKDATKLVEIISQFELALSYESSDEKITKYKNGFKMFLSMFKNFLQQIGVSEIEIAIGDEFDSAFMECLEIVNDRKLKNNQVSEIITKGYRLHDRIIQIAVVKIVDNKN